MIIAHKYLSGLAHELGCTLRTAKTMRQNGIIQKVEVKNSMARPNSKAEKQRIEKGRNAVWIFAPSFIEAYGKATNKPGRGKRKSI